MSKIMLLVVYFFSWGLCCAMDWRGFGYRYVNSCATYSHENKSSNERKNFNDRWIPYVDYRGIHVQKFFKEFMQNALFCRRLYSASSVVLTMYFLPIIYGGSFFEQAWPAYPINYTVLYVSFCI